jgi:hypothetical protein
MRQWRDRVFHLLVRTNDLAAHGTSSRTFLITHKDWQALGILWNTSQGFAIRAPPHRRPVSNHMTLETHHRAH